MRKISLLILILALTTINLYSECDEPECPPGEPCPSDTLSTFPPNGSWTDGGCVGVQIQWDVNNTCNYTVCFCYRITGEVAPFTEIFFKCVKSTSACYFPVSQSQLKYELVKGIIQAKYQDLNWSIPPCDYTNDASEFQVYDAACKDEFGCHCSTGGAYCSQKYKACIEQNGDVNLVFDGDPTVLGTCVDEACHAFCD
jgi:hypothetical protein